MKVASTSTGFIGLFKFNVMEINNEFKILTGTAKEVETELNKLNETYWVVILGISTTNEQTTIVVNINKRD